MCRTSVLDGWIPAIAFCGTLWIIAHDDDRNRCLNEESEFWGDWAREVVVSSNGAEEIVLTTEAPALHIYIQRDAGLE